MNFTNWLDTFLEEKGIDLEETFTLLNSEGVENFMPYAVVIEHIKIAPQHEQKAIKEMIVKIDFKNGDVRHFLRHLAQAIVG
jgi:hypothetical protein